MPTPEFAEVRAGLAHLAARVLVVDHPAEGLQTAALLRHIGVACDVVGDGALAVQVAASCHYDVILMALDLPVLDGLTAATVLRATGFAGPIIALTPTPCPDGTTDARLRQAGCSASIGIPVKAATLGATLAAVLAAPVPRQRVPVLPPSDTGFEHLPAFAGFRNSFLAALGARMGDLASAVAGADWHGVASLAHTLKGAGGTFGFPLVSQYATEIETGARAADRVVAAAALLRLQAHVDSLI
ncbi:Hpt domain-containing protein [Massilia sp. DWR3-1-1]|uniref:Hpt domain-containing protein n=1 Tax=Massilia sp. DWR3-1-1 TaxID=2804559 RepID=UPI003CF42D29